MMAFKVTYVTLPNAGDVVNVRQGRGRITDYKFSTKRILQKSDKNHQKYAKTALPVYNGLKRAEYN